MVKDNGWSIAQKGFNYQNCVVSLVAIRNYNKSNFSIYVETDEDFEVTYDDSFRNFDKLKGSGINLNKDLLVIFLVYMNLVDSKSITSLPFAIDSFVKNETDKKVLKKDVRRNKCKISKFKKSNVLFDY